jgi:hypothetical protein
VGDWIAKKLFLLSKSSQKTAQALGGQFRQCVFRCFSFTHFKNLILTIDIFHKFNLITVKLAPKCELQHDPALILPN